MCVCACVSNCWLIYDLLVFNLVNWSLKEAFANKQRNNAWKIECPKNLFSICHVPSNQIFHELSANYNHGCSMNHPATRERTLCNHIIKLSCQQSPQNPLQQFKRIKVRFKDRINCSELNSKLLRTATPDRKSTENPQESPTATTPRSENKVPRVLGHWSNAGEFGTADISTSPLDSLDHWVTEYLHGKLRMY